MSADGDTFDIDIYGDEVQDEPSAQDDDQGADNNFYGDDDGYDYENGGMNEPLDHSNEQDTRQTQQSEQQRSQSNKRKAPSDEIESQQQTSHVDPSATVALKLIDLHWWTTEEDLRSYCNAAQMEEHLVDISFGEHKANGKSRGEAYLEFASSSAASAVKNEIEKSLDAGSSSTGEARRANPFKVYFTVAGNPFKGRDMGVNVKKDYNNNGTGRGGAYNNTFNNRGSFGGRGGGFSRGGGGFNRGGSYMNNNNNNNMMNSPQWGMNNGGMGMGFGANPMMAMGGYGNMGRGGMGGMMGRGGFGGMGNMGAMMNMGGRGGGGMMMGGGRGGWSGGGMMGGGMQQSYGGGGFGGGMGMQQGAQGQQQNQPNKRMKAE